MQGLLKAVEVIHIQNYVLIDLKRKNIMYKALAYFDFRLTIIDLGFTKWIYETHISIVTYEYQSIELLISDSMVKYNGDIS